MSTTELDIKGLVLESRCSETLMLVKGPMQQVWRDGFPVQEQKILRLQFDRYVCLVDQMAREQEWTEEECQYAMRGIAAQLADPMKRDEVWIHEIVRPNLPWPTYDETHPKQIHTIAQAIGMVAEALAYESQRLGGPRPMVIESLQKALGDAPAAAASVPEPLGEEAPDSDEMVAV
jgi:hypothetical protein